jgi:hydrogenase expression/formation protein HypC
VVELVRESNQARVDYMGTQFWVGIALLEQVDVGQYVLVHAGEAIQVMDETQAQDGLELWKEMLGEE